MTLMSNALQNLEADAEKPGEHRLIIVASIITIAFVLYYVYTQYQAAQSAASASTVSTPPADSTVGSTTDGTSDGSSGLASTSDLSALQSSFTSQLATNNAALQSQLTTGLSQVEQSIESQITGLAGAAPPTASINLSVSGASDKIAQYVNQVGSSTSTASGSAGLNIFGITFGASGGASNTKPSQGTDIDVSSNTSLSNDITLSESGYSSTVLENLLTTLANQANLARAGVSQIAELAPPTNPNTPGAGQLPIATGNPTAPAKSSPIASRVVPRNTLIAPGGRLGVNAN